MLATAYLPSSGINKLVFERVYGSNKVLNTSTDSDSSAHAPHRQRCTRHKHGRHRKSHRTATGSNAVTRLQQEDSLMHLSTHSEGCSHLEDHMHEPIDFNDPRPHRRSGFRRQSSVPEDLSATLNSLNIKQSDEDNTTDVPSAELST